MKILLVEDKDAYQIRQCMMHGKYNKELFDESAGDICRGDCHCYECEHHPDYEDREDWRRWEETAHEASKIDEG